jgi:hypothetical protein
MRMHTFFSRSSFPPDGERARKNDSFAMDIKGLAIFAALITTRLAHVVGIGVDVDVVEFLSCLTFSYEPIA